jgi:brefeldin A-resistance guanine nucleotide exchange factor 1
MSDVLYNIVISLCKFTTLLTHSESYNQFQINFGMNNKAQLACKTVFQLTQTHGDMLRDGWMNIFDCVIQSYKAKLLPRILLEVREDRLILVLSLNLSFYLKV